LSLRRYRCVSCKKTCTANPRGPLPKHCPGCRPGTSPGERRGANRARDQARRKTQLKASKLAAVSADINSAAALARALAGHPPEEAAARVGLRARGAELDALVALAKAQYPRLVDGSVEGLVEQLDLLIALCTIEALQHRGEVSPRDLPHMIRAAASARDLLAAGKIQPRYTQVLVELVGPGTGEGPPERGPTAT
jgi:hypothetical protein